MKFLAIAALVALAGCASAAPQSPPPSPSPPATASPSATPSWTWPPTTACGHERWPVKTGADPGAAAIDLSQVTDTTISALSALTPPPALPQDSRVPPVETTVYRVTATLTGYKMEKKDSDYHLILADAAGRTMIAEIPDPACVAKASSLLPGIETARSQFGNAGFHPGDVFQAANIVVTVTGVGFWDYPHGQAGVAANAIELHPVLSIQFGTPS